MTTSVPQLLVRSKSGVEVFPVPCPNRRGSFELLSSASSTGKGSAATLVTGENCAFHVVSSDGGSVLLQRPASIGLSLFSRSDGGGGEWSSVSFPGTSGVQCAFFSPSGNYVVTWERPIRATASSTSPPPPNLRLWDVSSSSSPTFLHGWSCKSMPQKLAGPNPGGIKGGEQCSALQFSPDERFVYHPVTNEVHVYDVRDFSNEKADAVSSSARPIFKLKCPNLSKVFFPPRSSGGGRNNQNNVADRETLYITLVPESKGKPARVTLHRLSVRARLVTGGGGGAAAGGDNNNSRDGSLSSSWDFSNKVLTSKSLYQMEDVSVQWSPRADAVLVQTQNTVDATGQSYYGSSSLYLLTSTSSGGGTMEKGTVHPVDLPGKGGAIVHDCAWCPDPSVVPPRFALLSGKMPPMASLHHGATAEPLVGLGEAHRNVLAWSPNGRTLCVAGFGNLAGGMDFWDLGGASSKAHHHHNARRTPQKAAVIHPSTGQPIADYAARAHCAVGYGWSPTSETFFVSTTSPRMNVDNGIALYQGNGYGPFQETGVSVAWDNTSYQPDRLVAVDFLPSPTLPKPILEKDVRVVMPSTVDKASSPSLSSNAKHTSQAQAAASPSSTQGGAYVPPSARGKSGGLTLAERMRREREGSTATAGKIVTRRTPGTVPGMVPVPTDASGTPTKAQNRKQRQKAAKLRKQQQEGGSEEGAATGADGTPPQDAQAPTVPAAAVVDPEKRIKKIRKLIKQIDDLKASGKELNEDQRKKLASEADIRAELLQLQSALRNNNNHSKKGEAPAQWPRMQVLPPLKQPPPQQQDPTAVKSDTEQPVPADQEEVTQS